MIMSESNICQHTKCPFNIRFSSYNNWIGQIGSYKGFCKFSDYEFGIRAGMKLLANYIRKGRKSIYNIINPYAPKIENNTSAYISYIQKAFDYYSVPYTNIEIGSQSYFVLCRAIAIYETGYVISFETLKYIYDKWLI